MLTCACTLPFPPQLLPLCWGLPSILKSDYYPKLIWCSSSSLRYSNGRIPFYSWAACEFKWSLKFNSLAKRGCLDIELVKKSGNISYSSFWPLNLWEGSWISCAKPIYDVVERAVGVRKLLAGAWFCLLNKCERQSINEGNWTLGFDLDFYCMLPGMSWWRLVSIEGSYFSDSVIVRENITLWFWALRWWESRQF